MIAAGPIGLPGTTSISREMKNRATIQLWEATNPMKTIHAVYENGVFRPKDPVELPEGCEVTLEPRPVNQAELLSPHQRRIHDLLSQSTDTGDPHLSERHNEHQP
jgi:predicted DNA-binding antitoxin AbrB/MazE fold protein